MMSRGVIRGFFCCALFVSTLCLGLLPPDVFAEQAFAYLGFSFTLTSFGVWFFLLGREAQKGFRARVSRSLPYLAVAIFCTLIVFMQTPPRFKVLYDEALLAGTAQGMYEKGLARPALAFYDGEPILADHIDKRPLVFPTLVALSHLVSGYRLENAALVNFLASAAALFFFQLLLRRWTDPFLAIAGALVMASTPAFSFWTTSYGFEALNLCLLIIVFFASDRFLEHPGPSKADLLMFTLLLAAQVRYESLVFCAVIPVLFYDSKHREALVRSQLLPALPVLILPLIWQRRLFGFNHFSSMVGAASIEVPVDRGQFSVANLGANIWPNLKALSGISPQYGFSWILSLLALLGLGVLMHFLIDQKTSAPRSRKTLIFFGAASCLLVFVTISAYFAGRLVEPESNRLGLIFLPFMVFSAMYFFHRLAKRSSNGARMALAVIVLVHLFAALPVIKAEDIPTRLSLQHEQRAVLEFVDKNKTIGNERLLIIDNPSLYAVRRMNAISFHQAHILREDIHRKLSSPKPFTVLVFQRLEKDGEDFVVAENFLAPEWRLHEIGRLQVSHQVRFKVAAIEK